MAVPVSPPRDTSSPSSWARVAGAVALLTLIISVLLTAFAWPSVRSSVHDIPLAVVGPAPAADRVSASLAERMPDAFAVTEVADTATAERLIRDREVYGAIDVSAGPPRVMIASAASAPVAQALQGVATALARAQAPAGSPAVAVRDVVALPADDPRGAGLAAGALPLVMGGLLAAALLTSLVRGTGRRVTGALAFAVTGGLAMAAILQFWLGSLDGAYLANAGAVALTIAATALTVLGLESLLGAAGLGAGAAVMMLIGNPFAGTSTAPEMLPGWSGALGQLLPPGAGGHLLRSTAFFDGHDAARSLTVLTAWVVLGAALCLISGVRARGRSGATISATVAPSPSPSPSTAAA
ncbi:hypothetical protein [Actinoplanes nipponensis]|uniref:hypothetical protein n=1 Tax=Actinoplanes nipponensis TaxID=135950 RepID=UPI001940A615|nr:hypothetical protein [Actinoplanes nipponensis]